MDREAIVQQVKDMTGMDTTEVTTIARNWIDYIQDDICSRYDWSFLTAENYIVTSGVYDTGTIAVTDGSATVTGTDTLWVSTMVGSHIMLPDGNYVEIVDVASNTELTIATTYPGSTASGQEYLILKVYYSLASDFKKMRYMVRIIPSSKKLPPVPEMVFTDYIPDYYRSSGEIKGYMFAGADSDSNTRIKLYPIQDSQKMVRYNYIKQLPSINLEGAESVIPSRMHQLFVFGLSEKAYDMADVMTKAANMKAYYEEALNKFVKEDMDISLDMVDRMAYESTVTGKGIARVGLNPDNFRNY